MLLRLVTGICEGQDRLKPLQNTLHQVQNSEDLRFERDKEVYTYLTLTLRPPYHCHERPWGPGIRSGRGS